MKEYRISLASARINAELTQEDVARKMHVSKNTIVNWEKGRVEMKPAQFNLYCEIVGAPRDIIDLSRI